MIAYVTLAAGPRVEPERVRLYCEESVEHFEWFRALGVEFKPSFVDDKLTHPVTDDGLMFSGNEQSWPECEQARPFPRGHKPAREGEAGGYLMEAILRGTLAAGARVVNECRAERLVQRDDGRVVGVVAVREGDPLLVKARRGVVLATGGFIFNKAMLAEHAPHLLQCNYPTGTPGDDGSGIRMGVGAGGDAINLGEGLVLNAYYPPSAHLKGVMVDALGRRFVNEDAYIGRTSDAILTRAQGRAYLVVDDALYGRTQAMHKLAAVEESFEALEKALAMPEGVLVQTARALQPLRRARRGSALPQGGEVAAPAPDAALRRARLQHAALDLRRLHARRSRRRGHRRGAHAGGRDRPRALRGRPLQRGADPRGPQLRERPLDRRRQLLRTPGRPARGAGARLRMIGAGSAVSALSGLFSPIRIGSLELRNRLVMSPMETGFGTREGLPSPRTLAYFEARAKGGVGLITLGACTVDPQAQGGAALAPLRERRRGGRAPRAHRARPRARRPHPAAARAPGARRPRARPLGHCRRWGPR